MTIVPSAVRRAFLAPTSSITRRVEFYQQDGQTPFAQDLWDSALVDGTVSLDLSNDERRTLEVVLANPDSRLDPTIDKLWYDKIIRVFYGVHLPPRPERPRVAVVEERGDLARGQGAALLRRLGTAVEGAFLPMASTLEDVDDYDVLVSISDTATGKSALLTAAWETGKSVMTCAPQATRAHAPLNINLVDSATTSAGSITVTPVARPWPAFSTTMPAWRRVVSIAPGAGTLATSGSASIMSIYGDDGGPQWVHTSLFRFADEAFPTPDDAEAAGAMLLDTVLTFLDTAFDERHWETQIGEFLIDSAATETESDGQVAVTCRDMVKRCKRSKLVTATTFEKGRSIESVIETMAANAWIPRRRLPVTGDVLDRDMTWESDTERWTVMRDLATSYNYDLRFDATGTLVMDKFADPLSSPVVMDLTVGPSGNLVSRGLRTSDSELYNHVVVVGEGTDSQTPPVWAEAINDNPLSPSRVSELGDRVIRHTSPMISTTAQAQELADTMLSVASLEEFELNFSTPLLPWVEPGHVIGLTDEAAGTWGPNRFLISSLSYPLDLSPMSGTGKRVINVR